MNREAKRNRDRCKNQKRRQTDDDGSPIEFESITDSGKASPGAECDDSCIDRQSLRETIAEVAARSYDLELKAITPDGQMTDAEMDSLIERLGEKKKPLDEVRDFSPVRQAIKELGASK